MARIAVCASSRCFIHTMMSCRPEASSFAVTQMGPCLWCIRTIERHRGGLRVPSVHILSRICA